MRSLPTEIKLTAHALRRLEERKNDITRYDTKNLMRSSCKWYGKDDLIMNSALYLHCLYVCRDSNQIGYLTDGDIEVVYNKNSKLAITILEVKEKFKPITQYIKPETLALLEATKELRKMKKIQICPDCGKEAEITSQGICAACRLRKTNAKSRDREYIPYVNLSKEQQTIIDRRRRVMSGTKHKAKEEVKKEDNIVIDPLEDRKSFSRILKKYGCEIPDDALNDILDVLLATDKLKDLCMTIAKSENQQAMLDLEQALNVIERKLQHDWEYNGFREADDIQFKGFLTWRRTLKGAIFFWKKLYQTNTLIELQRAWNAYTTDPNDKILLAGDEINNSTKRWQITTETTSTIFNTRRPFTRVFFAPTQEEAYDMFVKWLANRQLHEDKSKTTIVELASSGVDGRRIDRNDGSK